MLRFPLFALSTKGLRTLDGIRCRGRIARGGQSIQFTFTATRNTSTLYPGPLARSAHLAFLSLLTEAGRPVPQPLTWTWYDLTRRMNIVRGGAVVRQLQQAILATAGLMLQSSAALYAKTEGQPIETRGEALHLYQRVVFAGMKLPDGSVAERNELWLSDWYRQNLDSFFTAPLDYALWKYLDERSTIASRLYEFLLVNFYRPLPSLRINYETLVQFLPVKAEKYLSSAQRQLRSALVLLENFGLLKSVDWQPSKTALAQLVLERGDRLGSRADAGLVETSPPDDERFDLVEVEELRNLKPPEYFLVTDFYRLWSGTSFKMPTAKELQQAKDLIARHGQTTAKGIIEIAIKRMKLQWPDAKAFGAVTMYLPEAAAEYERLQRRREGERKDRQAIQAETREQSEKAETEATARRAWDNLNEEERGRMRESMLASQPKNLRKFPDLLERMCITELGKRLAKAPEVATVTR